MYRRSRQLRQISKILPFISSGNNLVQWKGAVPNSLNSCTIPLRYSFCISSRVTTFKRGFGSERLQVSIDYSSLSRVDDLLSFIESNLNELQGSSHLWLNLAGAKGSLKQDGTFLVLAGQFIGNSQIVTMLEKLKLLQQRYPELQVMGFHFGRSGCSTANQTRLLEMIVEEFVTFPILLSEKNFFEVENGPCYMLFKGFRNPVVYEENGLDIEILCKAIEKLRLEEKNFHDSSPSFDNLKCTWVKKTEPVREPDVSYYMQNLLFYLPACISVDESRNRLFVSDSNHHRVIVIDGNGKFLDCIGSSSGFEDGDFASAKMLRPASSFYDDTEDCLYIVDSGNHAIRRADMERRLVETLCPTFSISRKNNSIWTWIVDKLGFGRNMDSQSEESDSKESGFMSLANPWHLLRSADDSLYIINRSFETLWVLDSSSGEIKETVEGSTNIWETIKQLITDKISLIAQLPTHWLQQQTYVSSSQVGIPYSSLVSSVATFKNHIVVCNSVAQDLLKYSTELGTFSKFQYSNFEILGVPYWLWFPLERVNFSAEPLGACSEPDHLQSFSLLPGRIDIKVHVDIPVDTELVEPLQEGCIWRQTRGAATEVSGAEEKGVEKVGVAQQWYDELDTLAFSTDESEITDEDNEETSDVKSKDDRIHIDCAINTSPGTSELIIYAALYLRLRKHPDSQEDLQEIYAARIADILSHGRGDKIGKESCVRLLRSNNDLRDLIFMKPLHVRIKFDTRDHPKAVNKKDYILTDSSIEVIVSLEKK